MLLPLTRKEFNLRENNPRLYRSLEIKIQHWIFILFCGSINNHVLRLEPASVEDIKLEVQEAIALIRDRIGGSNLPCADFSP